MVEERNYKGDLRIWNGSESPWNDEKEEVFLRNKLLERKDLVKSNQIQVLRNFIIGDSDLIEPGVLNEALKGDDKALSLALGQLSNKEALLAQPQVKVVNPVVLNKVKEKVSLKNKTVCFSGFSDRTQAKDLWSFFRKVGTIKDIILPKRKDKYNNRYGFLVLPSISQATTVIDRLNGSFFGDSWLIMTFARPKNKVVDKETEVKKSVDRKTEG